MTQDASLPPGYFDRLYARDPDPWRFATSKYERDKYEATLRALPRPRFERGFEVGCSIGVLTQSLAARCAALLAVDVTDRALEQARTRCAGLPQVAFAQMRVPEEWPDGHFDLILFSEVLYYLSAPAIARTAKRARDCLMPDGAVLLVHYTLPTDYPCSGDAASEAFITASGFSPRRQLRAARYRLDLLQP
jgi:SAM-dependent methyltransferase